MKWKGAGPPVIDSLPTLQLTPRSAEPKRAFAITHLGEPQCETCSY